MPRLTAAFWVAVAVGSLAWALYLGIDRHYQADLEMVQTWLVGWGQGLNPYLESASIDYPPHAFALLWLLGFGSSPAAMAVYAIANAVLSVAACYLLVRWFAELTGSTLSRAEFISFVAMLLSSRAIRRAIAAGQTAPLVLILFVAAMLLARRRPVWAGVCFALASFKLNLAAGFGLSLLMLGHVLPLVVAAGVVALLTVGFAWSIHQPVGAVLGSYLHNLNGIYGGADFFRGVTGIRAGLADVFSNTELLQLAYPTLVGALLGAVVTLSLVRRPVDARVRAATVLACLLWSFASFVHQRYNTVLLFPALWMMRSEREGLIQHSVIRWILPTVGLLILVANIPYAVEEGAAQVLRLLPEGMQHIGFALANLVDEHGTRIVVLVALGLVLRQMAFGAPSSTPEAST